MFLCIHAPDARAIAAAFSPWVEMHGDDTAVLSLAPNQSVEQVRARAPHARIAVAETIELALRIARYGADLAGLPLDVLPPDPELFRTLDSWGIRSLADLAKLPEDGLMARLGERGVQLQRLARGTLQRPLVPETEETVFEVSAEMDHPIDLREPLLFLAGRFIHELSARLKAHSRAAQSLHLTLNRNTRTLTLPFPSHDPKFLVKRVERSLETQPPEEPVWKVQVRITPTAPRRVQHGLFLPAAPEPEKLELTLGKIRDLVGAANAGTPSLRNTYRPGQGLNDAPALAFRYFRPPLPARVDLASGTPRRIHARAVRGAVVQASGPWRSSGEWWQPDAWDRDEWDLVLDDGALYRLYLNRAAGEWFLEGAYD